MTVNRDGVRTGCGQFKTENRGRRNQLRNRSSEHVTTNTRSNNNYVLRMYNNICHTRVYTETTRHQFRNRFRGLIAPARRAANTPESRL